VSTDQSLTNTPLYPLLESAFEGLAVVERHSLRFVYVNPTLSAWLGEATSAADARLTDVLKLPSNSTTSSDNHLSTLANASHGVHFAQLLVKGGPQKQVKVRVCALNWHGEPMWGLVITEADVETADAAEPKLSRCDPLTGLGDRAFLYSRLTALLGGDRAGDRQFAVLFVDLDNFKQVNDAYGHLVGDRALQEVARRLTSCVRDNDHVVRFGGDEFVVLAEGIASASDIEPIVNRIHSVLEEPISLPDGEVTLTVSVGLAEASSDHLIAEDVLAAADRAMYASKRSGG
jgi:diguanylate cyclase (GGDEF)-like protein